MRLYERIDRKRGVTEDENEQIIFDGNCMVDELLANAKPRSDATSQSSSDAQEGSSLGEPIKEK